MRSLAGLVLAGLLSLGSTPCRAGDVKDYLGEGGQLKDKLTLTVVHNQDDAGRALSTDTWTVEPSGEWSHLRRGVNFGIRPALVRLVGKGKLTPPQLAALAQHLATQDFNKLPEKMGKRPAGQSWSTTLAFGKKRTTLDTEGPLAAEGPPRAGGGDWSRFVVLTLTVKGLLGTPEPGPKAPAEAK
jgi:hypothetical protein